MPRAKKISFPPLRTLPDPVFSIDAKGNICYARSGVRGLEIPSSEIEGIEIGEVVKGFNFTKWMDGKSPGPQSESEVYSTGLPLYCLLPYLTASRIDHGRCCGDIKIRDATRTAIYRVHQSPTDSFDRLSPIPFMKRVVHEAKRIADLDTYFNFCETGTGKEMIARVCHQSSRAVKVHLAQTARLYRQRGRNRIIRLCSGRIQSA